MSPVSLNWLTGDICYYSIKAKDHVRILAFVVAETRKLPCLNYEYPGHCLKRLRKNLKTPPAGHNGLAGGVYLLKSCLM